MAKRSPETREEQVTKIVHTVLNFLEGENVTPVHINAIRTSIIRSLDNSEKPAKIIDGCVKKLQALFAGAKSVKIVAQTPVEVIPIQDPDEMPYVPKPPIPKLTEMPQNELPSDIREALMGKFIIDGDTDHLDGSEERDFIYERRIARGLPKHNPRDAKNAAELKKRSGSHFGIRKSK